MASGTNDDHQQHRQYTLSVSEEDRQKSFDMEDKRWERGAQIRDWLKLLAMVALTLLWTFLIYYFQPGLR